MTQIPAIAPTTQNVPVKAPDCQKNWLAWRRLYEQLARSLNLIASNYSPYLVPSTTVFASLTATANGNVVFATDAQGPQDGATWGSVAVGVGTGALLRYDGTDWIVIG